MPEYYFEDLNPGDVFHSPNFVLSEQEMVEFASKYSSHFGGLIAGGFQTAALAWALAQKPGYSRHAQWQALVSTGFVGSGR